MVQHATLSSFCSHVIMLKMFLSPVLPPEVGHIPSSRSNPPNCFHEKSGYTTRHPYKIYIHHFPATRANNIKSNDAKRSTCRQQCRSTASQRSVRVNNWGQARESQRHQPGSRCPRLPQHPPARSVDFRCYVIVRVPGAGNDGACWGPRVNMFRDIRIPGQTKSDRIDMGFQLPRHGLLDTTVSPSMKYFLKSLKHLYMRDDLLY